MSVFEHEFKWTDSKSRVFGGDFFFGGGGIKLLIDAAQIFIKNILHVCMGKEFVWK